MNPRGQRAIRVLAGALVILLAAMALLPLSALGATNQVTGAVTTCGPQTPVTGAAVTLVDANGINAPLTTTTNGAGVYAFTPPTGSYTISTTRSGYYDASTSTPMRFDGSRTVTISVCMNRYGSPSKVLVVRVLNAGSPVAGASVAAFNVSNPTGKSQLVATNTTNASGSANLTLWPAPFVIRAVAPDFQTDQAVDVSSTSTTTINLVAGPRIFGQVRDTDGNFLGSGVVAWLYNPGAPASSLYRLIPAAVSASFYDIHAPAGTYTLIVDADGHLSHQEQVPLPTTNPHDVNLTAAPPELYRTKVAYGGNDWSNLTVWRNLTLNPDSTLPGLSPANLRNLRLQIDATLGNGDGTLSAGEIALFQPWLLAKGPGYATTDGFLTTNNRAYNSSLASYTVQVSPTLPTPDAKVWINTTATYSLKGAPPYIAVGAASYLVTMTMVPDSNTSAYQNYTYTVAFPRGYELTTSRVLPDPTVVDILGFSPAVIDPRVTTGTPQIQMTVARSLNGTANAKVTGPVGKFHVVNATFDKYQAYVAGKTVLTFSANDTRDPNDHESRGNFTWRFTSNPGDVRYNIWTAFNYTVNGTFTVNVTYRDTGGNVSYRDITVFVDDQLPIARFKTNRTVGDSATGAKLKVDEGIPVKFDGGPSTDGAYPGKNGTILDGGYSWDFNGDHIADATGRTVTHTFTKPGNFTVNLTVTDSVGWKSKNASMNAIINDTKAPVPAFDILDSSKDWGTITSPMERKTYSFNASRTTDDHDKYNYSGGPGLNVTWTIPGPIVGMTGTNHTFYGINVTFAWQEWNSSYTVRLAVKDSGFGSNKPNTGYLNRSVQVQIDVTLHADLKVEAGTLKLNPADPEESAQMTVTVNVTNKAGRAAAGNVTTQVLAISGGVTTVVATQADWFDKNGNPKGSKSIASPETVTLVFHLSLSGQGNKTLQVYVYDSSEPYTWITSENRASLPVNVRQPAWQPYAIYGSVIGIIALFVFGMYARRKIKAGEWRPLRGRREKGGEEKEKPRREIKEEKKRL